MIRRGGFSLFEVMIATAVFVLGLTLILQMLGTSELFSRRAAETITAQVICQNKMNEIAMGLADWSEVKREECKENTDFWYSIRTLPHPALPLQQVEVVVWPKSVRERNSNSGSATATDEPLAARQVRLSCLLPRDPDPLLKPQVPLEVQQ
jgi:Tfp pilus assembly protein PilV